MCVCTNVRENTYYKDSDLELAAGTQDPQHRNNTQKDPNKDQNDRCCREQRVYVKVNFRAVSETFNKNINCRDV